MNMTDYSVVVVGTDGSSLAERPSPAPHGWPSTRMPIW